MSEFGDLYQQVILDHNQHPRNFQPLQGKVRRAEGHNPLCGDRLTLWVDVKADTKGLGKLAVFAGVREFPVRVKCASLPWHTLRSALEGETARVTTEETEASRGDAEGKVRPEGAS